MSVAARNVHTMLTVRDHMMLDLEQRRYKYPGAKEQDIRELFDMSATRYYAVLNRLVERDEALQVAPVLVRRLRRLKGKRQGVRARI